MIMNSAEALSQQLPETQHIPNAVIPEVIEPKWWTGTSAISPERFTIDCSQYRMSDADLQSGSELDQRMNQIFDEIGLVHLVNTGLFDMQKMREAALLVMKKQMEYKGGSNPAVKNEASQFDR